MQVRQTVWQVAIRKRENESCILDDIKTPFVVIPNPRGKWAADPFVYEKDGKIYIFAELFNVLSWKADIAYCVYEKGSFSKWKVVISDSHHFSFPYVYEQEGMQYLMPETSKKEEISQYKSIEFPNVWKKERIISGKGCYADSILLNENYILTYCVEKNQKEKLVILCIDNKNSKIVFEQEDCERKLRPAGAVFNYFGKKIRPVQDCSQLYGGAIEFNEITFGANQSLIENTIFRVNPKDVLLKKFNYKLIGIHTYNSSRNYEVIDIQYKKFDILDILKRTQMKFVDTWKLNK